MRTDKRTDGLPANGFRLVTLTCENHHNVLARVTSMISRRGFDLETLSVGEALENPEWARMTALIDPGYSDGSQVAKQLDRLVEVVTIRDLTEVPHVSREFLIASLRCPPERRPALDEITGRYACRLLEEGGGTLVLEASGKTADLDALVAALRDFDILDLARTGPLAIQKETDHAWR